MNNLLTISGRAQQKVRRDFEHVSIKADAAHPNQLKFKGVLVTLDEPSTKPPNGAMGHLIQLPTAAAEKALDTLIGMGVNYHQDLNAHDPSFKVGVIQKAWIKGNKLWVSGYVWVQDFPDAEKVLNTPGMGMSMELTKVLVEDRTADIWILSSFVFTGATFLRKSSAAYFDTSAIAAAGDDSTTLFLNMEAAMPDTNKTPKGDVTETVTLTPEQQEIANVAAAAASASITAALGIPLASIAAALEKSAASTAKNNELMATLNERLEAAEDDDDMDGAGKKKPAAKADDDDDDNWDEDDDDNWDEDDDDDDDVDAGLEPKKGGDGDKDSDLTDQNKDSGKFGNKSELKTKQGEVKASKWKSRALKAKAALTTAKAENAELKAAKSASTTTVKATAERAVRATLDAGAINLLAKNGIDANTILASGQQLDATEIDACFANLDSPLDPEQRIQLKMQFKNAGIMKDPMQQTARRTK